MSKAKVVLSEKYLLTALDRVAKNALGYAVLYINISKLKPKNRHPEFVKIIAMLFESIIGAAKGSMYILSNGDIAILSKILRRRKLTKPSRNFVPAWLLIRSYPMTAGILLSFILFLAISFPFMAK